jgi:hypothetical protein
VPLSLESNSHTGHEWKVSAACNFSQLANINSFMSGDLLVFGDDTYVEKNQIYSALFEQSPYDKCLYTC